MYPLCSYFGQAHETGLFQPACPTWPARQTRLPDRPSEPPARWPGPGPWGPYGRAPTNRRNIINYLITPFTSPRPQIWKKWDWAILIYGNGRYGYYKILDLRSKIEKCTHFFAAVAFWTLGTYFGHVVTQIATLVPKLPKSRIWLVSISEIRPLRKNVYTSRF